MTSSCSSKSRVYSNKDQIKAKKQALEKKLTQLREEEEKTLIQKEQEIKESSEALKQQMLHKIRQKKAELFSLKKDNFSEEIEIIIQQNYHYTNQLDYQTKHFEYLIVQNEKLKIQLENMSSDYEIHKNVQTELAKRIFLSNQIIEELKNTGRELDIRKTNLEEKSDKLGHEIGKRSQFKIISGRDKENAEQLEKLVREKTKLGCEANAVLILNSGFKRRLFEFLNQMRFLICLVNSIQTSVFDKEIEEGFKKSSLEKSKANKTQDQIKGHSTDWMKSMFLKKN